MSSIDYDQPLSFLIKCFPRRSDWVKGLKVQLSSIHLKTLAIHFYLVDFC